MALSSLICADVPLRNYSPPYPLRPRVTLIIDLMTLKVVSFSCPDDHVSRLASKWQNQLIRFQNVVFTSLITNKRTG